MLKDRYSHVFLTLFLGLSMYFLLTRTGDKQAAAIIIILTMALSGVALAILALSGARLHATGDKEIEYKGEDECGFSPRERVYLDGIRIKGDRYKFVNGVDICLDGTGRPRPCGPGSALMQTVGGGGHEPKSIQGDSCWE